MNIAYYLRNKRGFTLIELLLTLSVLLILLAFFPLLMNVLVKGHTTKNDTPQDVVVFFNFLARDIRESKVVTLGDESVHLEMDGNEQYVIERIRTTNRIRRQRRGSGNVLMLEYVRRFHCSSVDQLIQCEIELLDGRKMSRTMLSAT